MDHDDGLIRVQAALAYGRITGKTDKATLLLKKELENKDVKVRVAAAKALWNFNHNTDGLDVLIEALKESEFLWPDWDLGDTLDDMGPAVKKGLPALRKMVEKGYGYEYRRAYDLVKKLDPDAANLRE